jgi:hypothetical protein
MRIVPSALLHFGDVVGGVVRRAWVWRWHQGVAIMVSWSTQKCRPHGLSLPTLLYS